MKNGTNVTNSSYAWKETWSIIFNNLNTNRCQPRTKIRWTKNFRNCTYVMWVETNGLHGYMVIQPRTITTLYYPYLVLRQTRVMVNKSIHVWLEAEQLQRHPWSGRAQRRTGQVVPASLCVQQGSVNDSKQGCVYRVLWYYM